MGIAKRVFFFLLTNIAILAVIMIVLSIAQIFVPINITWYGYDLVGVWIFSLIVWFIWAFVSLWISKWMAKTFYKVQTFDETKLHSVGEKERFVYQIVERIASSNNIKMPEVWVYQSNEPNAFATWPTKNKSLVAVSSGLLDQMTYDEIEWVVWHEMAHILNWDMVTMTLLQWVINTFVIFLSRIAGTFIDRNVFWNEDWPGLWYFLSAFVLQIIFGILASTVVAWFSRHREFRADAGSAALVGKEKMIAWLEKLDLLVKNMQTDNSNQSMNTMKIVSKDWIMKLFASHPPIEERIKNLRNN